MKRSVTSVLLFICLLAPLATGFLFVKWHKAQVRREIKKQIIEGDFQTELVKIVVHDKQRNNAITESNSHEIKYQGKWHDIVRTEKQGELTVLWCIPDEKEDVLHEQITLHLHSGGKKSGKEKDGTWHMFKFLDSLFFEEVYAIHFGYGGCEKTTYPSSKSELTTAYLKFPEPPPKTS